MNTWMKITGYQIRDVLRSRGVLLYGAALLLLTHGLLIYSGDPVRALLSLTNVVLVLVPLVSITFGASYVYGTRPFTELLLSQPVARGTLYAALYGGLAIPLVGAFLLGIGAPFLFVPGTPWSTLLVLLAVGALLTTVFAALATWIAVGVEDRLRGVGLSLLLWLGFTVLYDAGVLLAVRSFSAYPLEGPVLTAMAFNPVDLARVVLLLEFDLSAMLGYTGALFEQVFGTALGLGLALGLLLLWTAAPAWMGGRAFRTKDF